MDKFIKAFDGKFSEAYKVVSEYYFYVDSEVHSGKLGVKILLDATGDYAYVNSHHYKGSDLAGPYVSSINYSFKSEDEALSAAKRELFSLANDKDNNSKWIYNDDFFTFGIAHSYSNDEE